MPEAFVLYDPNGPDLEFSGELIIDRRYQDMGRIRIYKTEGGTYIYQQERGALRGTTAVHRLEVFENFELLHVELRQSWAGKDILEHLGQPDRRMID